MQTWKWSKESYIWTDHSKLLRTKPAQSFAFFRGILAAGYQQSSSPVARGQSHLLQQPRRIRADQGLYPAIVHRLWVMDDSDEGLGSNRPTCPECPP